MPQKSMSLPSGEIGRLVRLLDEAFRRKSWHGTNLRGALRSLSVAQAVWRPAPQRKCIAEHVLHAAYWKYVVRRRLLGEKRGSFPLKGSNWIALPAPFDDQQWDGAVRLLEDQHEALRSAVASLRPAAVEAAPPGSTTTNLALIHGAALHDIYHTGQIQLLKALQRP